MGSATRMALIVDDEPDICEIIEFEIQSKGFKTLVKNCGKDALEAARNQKFDLIISDVRMPNGSGVDLLNGVKQLDYKPLFIFLTGFADISEEEARQKGAWGIIEKPIDFKVLHTAIDSHIK